MHVHMGWYGSTYPKGGMFLDKWANIYSRAMFSAVMLIEAQQEAG